MKIFYFLLLAILFSCSGPDRITYRNPPGGAGAGPSTPPDPADNPPEDEGGAGGTGSSAGSGENFISADVFREILGSFSGGVQKSKSSRIAVKKTGASAPDCTTFPIPSSWESPEMYCPDPTGDSNCISGHSKMSWVNGKGSVTTCISTGITASDAEYDATVTATQTKYSDGLIYDGVIQGHVRILPGGSEGAGIFMADNVTTGTVSDSYSGCAKGLEISGTHTGWIAFKGDLRDEVDILPYFVSDGTVCGSLDGKTGSCPILAGDPTNHIIELGPPCD